MSCVGFESIAPPRRFYEHILNDLDSFKQACQASFAGQPLSEGGSHLAAQYAFVLSSHFGSKTMGKRGLGQFRYVFVARPRTAQPAAGPPAGRPIAQPKPAAPPPGLQRQPSSSADSAAAPPTARPPAAASAPRAIAERRDAPVVEYRVGRASRPTEALTDGDRAAMMQKYQDEKSASGSRSARSSVLSSWEFYHRRWFGPEVPVFPLTAEKLDGVCCQLKDRGYTAMSNYISTAKDEHLNLGYNWTEFLDRTSRQATRSGTRGIGGPKQDAELDLDLVFNLGLEDDSLTAEGPIGPGRLCEFACFFVLREVEASLCLAHSVDLNWATREVTVQLPVSKTDPRAVGCSRTWGCVCHAEPHDVPCAFHALAEQMALLKRRFGDPVPSDLPLFPTSGGKAAEKRRVVEMIEACALRLGLPLLDEHGRNRFGGHSFRITGSRRLAALGLSLPLIMLLARWGSEVIRRYVAEAPLKCLTREFRARSSAAAASSAAVPIAAAAPQQAAATGFNVAPLAVRLEAVEARAADYARQEAELQRISEACASISGALQWPKYVVNKATGCVHHSGGSGCLPLLRSSARTPCGWVYDEANGDLMKELPPSAVRRQICGRCLPDLRTALAAAALDCDSSGE